MPPVSRPSIERLKRLQDLIQTERYPNCRTMAEALEVSRKTVQRDLDFVRDRMAWPLAYDQTKFGYYFTGPLAQFPSVEVSEGEIVALFVAERALAQYRGTAFEKPLRAACRKIAESLQGKFSLDWAELDAAVSFKSAGVSRTELAVFEAVSSAVLDSVEIAFQYHKLKSEQIELRRARPYHLGCVEGQWYCFAHDLDRGQLRTFALPRMRAVKVTRTKFQRPADFSIQRHLAGSFGVFREDGETRPQRVRIRFDPWAARLVSERLWHESQELRPLKGGGIELRLELAGLHEVERWILSWGEHAEVLAPKSLHRRITAVAKLIAGRAEMLDANPNSPPAD